MEDIQQQLAALRQRIARVDRKYAGAAPPPPPPARLSGGHFIEELLSGEVVTTPLGQHFETEKLWESPPPPRQRLHLAISPNFRTTCCDPLSAGAIENAHPTRWAFLDTETTGLAGGTGTYAFLIGVGSIDSSGFRLRQFFMRDYGEEASLLHRLAEYLAPVRRADHLQRQVLRPAAARNPLPHGRARGIPSTACSTSTCSSARAASGNCAWIAAAWWIWRTAFSAWSARAICPAR